MDEKPELQWKGKVCADLSREDLEKALEHFHEAHWKTTLRMADALRRMSKLEEGYTKEEIANLDDWLKYHIRDPEKGDGTPKYINWRRWKRNEKFGGLPVTYRTIKERDSSNDI